jgi:hypothetical protein
MRGISQIANTMATRQRRNVEKNSTTPRKDHPINVMPRRVRHARGGVVKLLRAKVGISFCEWHKQDVNQPTIGVG